MSKPSRPIPTSSTTSQPNRLTSASSLLSRNNSPSSDSSLSHTKSTSLHTKTSIANTDKMLNSTSQDLSQPSINMTTPLTAPPITSSNPLSFSAVIEQDHFEIRMAASTLLRLSTNPATATPSLLRSHLDTATWRLIRHDISEDMIMRPAFMQHLGAEGAAMCAHDRADHAAAKATLLKLFESDLLQDDAENKLSADTRASQIAVFVSTIAELFAELAQHMKVESGEQIPRLESILGREVSEELGRRYKRTLVLTPELVVGGRKVWEGGVLEYVRTKNERFREVFREWEAENPEASVEMRVGERGKL